MIEVQYKWVIVFNSAHSVTCYHVKELEATIIKYGCFDSKSGYSIKIVMIVMYKNRWASERETIEIIYNDLPIVEK